MPLLRKILAEIKSKKSGSEEMKKAQDKKATMIAQQISMLNMQLVQIQQKPPLPSGKSGLGQ
jgi:hypothetical protein